MYGPNPGPAATAPAVTELAAMTVAAAMAPTADSFSTWGKCGFLIAYCSCSWAGKEALALTTMARTDPGPHISNCHNLDVMAGMI
jgi:hypothetical protein